MKFSIPIFVINSSGVENRESVYADTRFEDEKEKSLRIVPRLLEKSTLFSAFVTEWL